MKKCETVNVQRDEAYAYAVTEVVRLSLYDRIDAMGKLIGMELPKSEPVVIKGCRYSTGGATANSYIMDDVKFNAEDKFLGILLKRNEVSSSFGNGYAGHSIYEEFYLILRYPEEMSEEIEKEYKEL